MSASAPALAPELLTAGAWLLAYAEESPEPVAEVLGRAVDLLAAAYGPRFDRDLLEELELALKSSLEARGG